MKQNIYYRINIELKKIVAWSKSSQSDFALDRLYDELFKEYRIDISYGILNHIFCLADAFYDSVSHDNPIITDNYSTVAAREDLEYVIKMIDQNRIEELENDFELRKRLLSVYD